MPIKKAKVEKPRKRVAAKLVAKKPVVKKQSIFKRVVKRVEKPIVSRETPEMEAPAIPVEAPEVPEKPVTAVTKPSKAKIPEALVVLPVWEGKQVLRIRSDGKELEAYYHCDLQDGTTVITAHVPKALF